MIPATFTRASVAHKLDGSQVASGVPRYEAGLNGQAIMVEEGTVNLLPLDLGQWGIEAGASRSALGETYLGQPVYRANSSATGSHIAPFSSNAAGVAVGDWLTLSFHARAYNGVAGGYAYISGVDSLVWSIPNDGQWHRVAISRQATSTIGTCEIRTNAGAAGALDFCTGQVEKKPYATSVINGTRAAETLSLPTAGLISPAAGCIEIDFQLVRLTANYQPIFNTQIASGNRLLIMGNSGRIKVWDGDGTSELIVQADAILAAGQWYRVAYVWGPGGRTLVLDGAIKTDPRSNPIGVGASTFLGWWGGYSPGVLIDRLRLYNRALTDAELLASCEGRL